MKPAQTTDVMQTRLDEIDPRLRQLLGILNMRLPQTQGLTIADAMFRKLQERALQESASNAISLRGWLVKRIPAIWREYHSPQKRLPTDSEDIFRTGGTVTVPWGVDADEFKQACKRGLPLRSGSGTPRPSWASRRIRKRIRTRLGKESFQQWPVAGMEQDPEWHLHRLKGHLPLRREALGRHA